MALIIQQRGLASRNFGNASRNRVILFLNNNVSGALIAKNIVPRLLDRNIDPVLFVLKSPDLPKSQIPELIDFSLFESMILGTMTDFLNLSGTNGSKPANDNLAPQHLIDLAQNNNLELYHESDVNNSVELKKLLDSNRVLGGISIRNLQLFNETCIRDFKNSGAFLWNIHSGDLPEYRGVHPMLRAIADGKKASGWTLHVIDKGIDTGSIINTNKGPLSAEVPYMTQFFAKVPEACDLIVNAVEIFQRDNRVLEHLNDKSQGRYFTFPTAEEIYAWEQRGIRLVDATDMIPYYLDLLAGGDPQKADLVTKALQSALLLWEKGRQNPRFSPIPTASAG